MKRSQVRPTGPHYTIENSWGHGCRIFVNGVEIEDVIEAHTEDGYVIAYDRPSYVKGMSSVPVRRLVGSVTVTVGDMQ